MIRPIKLPRSGGANPLAPKRNISRPPYTCRVCLWSPYTEVNADLLLKHHEVRAHGILHPIVLRDFIRKRRVK